jgi:hypothetical protein
VRKPEGKAGASGSLPNARADDARVFQTGGATFGEVTLGEVTLGGATLGGATFGGVTFGGVTLGGVASAAPIRATDRAPRTRSVRSPTIAV